MDNRFFEHPVLNSPYEEPRLHWELDAEGQPTQNIIESRRCASFITPIPKPRKHKNSDAQQLVFDEGKGLSTPGQVYNVTSIINQVREHVNAWIPSVNNAGSYGRWAFAELTDVYLMESDLEAKLRANFNKMIDSLTSEII